MRKIKKEMIVEKPKRQIIDADTLMKIEEYLIKVNKQEFLAMVMLCYHGFLRPKEICLLKPGNIHLKDGFISLDNIITIYRGGRKVIITRELEGYLKALNLESIPKDYYIFSTNFKPGDHQINSVRTGREWSNLRAVLELPIEYTFHSLKYAGIVQKLMDGTSPIEIKKQAGYYPFF